MEKILITGGAGYIGSHVTQRLVQEGYDVLVIDNLSTGYRESIPGVPFEHADIRDTARLEEVFEKYKISAVMHLADALVISESVEKPLKYYTNNIAGTVSLLEVVRKFGIEHFVFSSSASVYGRPTQTPIDEGAQISPLSPYGQTKAMVETILKDCEKAYRLKYVTLRYFNAAGKNPKYPRGEMHNPETHLIPLALKNVLAGKPVIVYGNDYPTKDGTCVRDYIHVDDIAEAHLLSLKYLLEGGKSEIFNLGNGKGFSVLEVIEALRTSTDLPVTTAVEPRREGDPPLLIASSEKVRDILGWKPAYTKIEDIIKTAFDWEQHLKKSS